MEALKTKEIASIPLTYFELERNSGMFGNLLGEILGNAHTLTQAYHNFWCLLSQGLRMEIQQIINVKGYIKPAHILIVSTSSATAGLGNVEKDSPPAPRLCEYSSQFDPQHLCGTAPAQ